MKRCKSGGYLFSVTSDVSLKAGVESIVRLRRGAGACECANETLGSIKCGGISWLAADRLLS